MKTAVALAFSVLSTVPYVTAHGYVGQITVDGTAYKGNTPNSNNVKSPIRMIDDVSPVKGATNKYLSCDQNAQKALDVAAAKPGSKVSFQWVNGSGGNWSHNVGPLMTYMASCGGAGCAAFDSADAKWFKIAQAGRLANGTWAQAALTTGAAPTVQLPDDIAPGEYLIRHEIIALHAAMSAGGAEFYPSCAQLAIEGSGPGVAPNATMTFPGAYEDTDAGLLVDVYDLVGAYVFPGPAISNLAGKMVGADGSVSDDDSSDSEGGATSRSGAASFTSTSISAVSSATSTTSSTSATVSADEYELECDDQADEQGDAKQIHRRRSRVMHSIF
ncbi:glycosyl hydrolase family 61-domain-containing protein [Trametes maxima]|nr:glycosyl hydrolase family 61-domain-containing protein [Trametes maxima]